MRTATTYLITPAACCVLMLAVYFVGQSASPEINNVATEIAITVILVVALHLFVGLTGVFSFGHMSFAAVGAYTAALTSMTPQFKHVLLPALPHWITELHLANLPAVLLGGAVAAVFAALMGRPIMRLVGPAASIGTLALLLIVNISAGNATFLTGGYTSLTGVNPISLGVCTLSAILVIVACWVLQQSTFGLRLKAGRENYPAALASGLNVERDRTLVFAISGFVAGIGGALYGEYLGAFNPNSFYLPLTFLTVAMLVVGGIGSLWGAVVGGVLLTVLSEVLRRAEEGRGLVGIPVHFATGLSQVVLGALMLLVLLVRPAGVTGGREVWLPRRRPAPTSTSELSPAHHAVSRPSIDTKESHATR